MSLMMTEIVIGTDIFLMFMLIAVPIGINDKYNIKAILYILKLDKYNIVNRLNVQDFLNNGWQIKTLIPQKQ